MFILFSHSDQLYQSVTRGILKPSNYQPLLVFCLVIYLFIYFFISSQTRYLLPGLPIRLKFLRNDPDFSLMSEDVSIIIIISFTGKE